MPDDCILAYRESDGLPICRTHNCLLSEVAIRLTHQAAISSMRGWKTMLGT